VQCTEAPKDGWKSVLREKCLALIKNKKNNFGGRSRNTLGLFIGEYLRQLPKFNNQDC
jgi:hypothetical protein